MASPYEIITLSRSDLFDFECDPPNSKVGLILSLVLEELPQHLHSAVKYVFPYLEPIEGFEDEKVKGFQVSIDEDKRIEKFVRDYLPFFIMRKE